MTWVPQPAPLDSWDGDEGAPGEHPARAHPSPGTQFDQTQVVERGEQFRAGLATIRDGQGLKQQLPRAIAVAGIEVECAQVGGKTRDMRVMVTQAGSLNRHGALAERGSLRKVATSVGQSAKSAQRPGAGRVQFGQRVYGLQCVSVTQPHLLFPAQLRSRSRFSTRKSSDDESNRAGGGVA